jgi:hypothetical protein
MTQIPPNEGLKFECFRFVALTVNRRSSYCPQLLFVLAMAFESFRDSLPQESAYSRSQVVAWLQQIRLPLYYRQYIDDPQAFPKTKESLKVLFSAQITSFPYENLSVHYSPTHLVNIRPSTLYTKLMGPLSNGRGGYCMELSIFFHHMLRGLGFHVYLTGVRNRTRTDGVPQGETQGW